MSKTLVQINLSDQDIERLDRLRESTGLGTRTKTIKTALSVFDAIYQNIKQGYPIKCGDGENEKIIEIILPYQ